MTTVPPVPSPRPAEEIRADLALLVKLDGTRSLAVFTAQDRLLDDVPALLARLRAAEEALAAVGALCDQIEAESLLPGASGRPVARAVVEDLRAALAEGASR